MVASCHKFKSFVTLMPGYFASAPANSAAVHNPFQLCLNAVTLGKLMRTSRRFYHLTFKIFRLSAPMVRHQQ